MDGVTAYNASMESYGYVYIPQRCEPGTGVTCRLHMFFHGCTMTVKSEICTTLKYQIVYIQS